MLPAALNWKTVPLPVYKSSSVYIFICSLWYKSETFALPVRYSVYIQPDESIYKRITQWITDKTSLTNRARLSVAYGIIKHPKHDFFLLHRVLLAHRATQATQATGCVEFKMLWKYLSVIISQLTLYFLSCSSHSANVLFYIQPFLSGLCCVSEAGSSAHKTRRRQSVALPKKKKIVPVQQHRTLLRTNMLWKLETLLHWLNHSNEIAFCHITC